MQYFLGFNKKTVFKFYNKAYCKTTKIIKEAYSVYPQWKKVTIFFSNFISQNMEIWLYHISDKTQKII